MTSKVALILTTLLLAPAVATAGTLSRVRVDTPDAPIVAARLISDGYDVLDATIADKSFEVVATADQLVRLQKDGLSYVVLERGRPFREIQAERTSPERNEILGYPDLAGVIDAMTVAETNFPALCHLVDLTDAYGLPTTFDGRHLFALKISDNVAQDEAEPAMLIVAAHHCREIVSTVIAMHAIEQFTTQYGVDATITDLVNEYEIWVAPVWNPDGYDYVFTTDNLWRKNRNEFPGGVGVDLNRNYPYGWNAICGGSNIVPDANYRGPAPASEIETQTMIAFAEDRHFAKVADFHSYAREVRYGTGCLSYPFSSFLASEAAALASTMPGYFAASSCCTGGDIHHHFATHGALAFLWETHTAFQPPYESAQSEAALVFPSILALMQRPISLSGRVTDSLTGEPVAAAITLVGVDFQNGEVNGSDARLGRYQAFLPAGAYTVAFNAAGYIEQTQVVNVIDDGALVLDIALEREGVGDYDSDGDVDLSDFSQFVLCFAGAGQPQAATCPPGVDADLDDDGDVDLADFSQFSLRFTGPS